MKKSFGLFILLTAIFISVSVHAEFIEELVYPLNNLDSVSTDGTTVSISGSYMTGSPHDSQTYVRFSGPDFTYDGRTLTQVPPSPTAEPTPPPQPPYTDQETTELPGSTNKICRIEYSRYCLINEQGYPISAENYWYMLRVGNYIFVRCSSEGESLIGVMDFNGNMITPLKKRDFRLLYSYSDNGLMQIRYDSQSKYNIVDYRLEPLLDKNYDRINFIKTKDKKLFIMATSYENNTSIIMDGNLNVLCQGKYTGMSIDNDGELYVQNPKGGTYLTSDFKELFPIDKYSVEKDGDLYIIRDSSTLDEALGTAEGAIISEWFDYIKRLSDDRFHVLRNYKHAITDSSGKVLSQWFDGGIEVIWENSNIYVVDKNIFINENGEIINDSCRNIKKYRNGLYLADIGNKKAVINSDGKTVICMYDDISPLPYSDYYKITDNGLYGVLDTSAQVLIEPQYTATDIDFLMSDDYLQYAFYHLDGINDFTDFYDKDGHLIFRGKGAVSYSKNKLYITKKTINGEYRFAFIDHSGNLLTDFIYTEIDSKEYILADSEGETLCRKVMLDGDVMYLDENFNRYDIYGRVYWITVNDSRNQYKDFGDVIFSKIDNMAAIIDKQTNSYILPYTEDCGITAYGESMVQTVDNKSAILDLYGNTIIQLDYPIEKAEAVEDGIVKVQDRSKKYFYIDEWGNNIFPDRYMSISRLDSNSFAAVKPNGLVLLKNYNSPFAVNTDIRVFINGFEIPCCCFNGQVLIKTDDLKGYGFDVIWNEQNRKLYIDRNKEYYNVNPVEIPAKGISGEYYASIIPTDISVRYSFNTLRSYCINNEMFICPEDLTAKGVSYEYNNDARTLYISVDGLAQR